MALAEWGHREALMEFYDSLLEVFKRPPVNENCRGPNVPELRAAEKAGLKRAFQLEGTKDAYDKVITFDSALTTVAASGLFDRLMGEKHATREEQACNFIVQILVGSHLLFMPSHLSGLEWQLESQRQEQAQR